LDFEKVTGDRVSGAIEDRLQRDHGFVEKEDLDWIIVKWENRGKRYGWPVSKVFENVTPNDGRVLDCDHVPKRDGPACFIVRQKL
jgi:hypothetical protein